MKYAEHPLPPPLDGFLECVWAVRAESGEGPGQERVIPDGCPELVVQLGDPFAGEVEGSLNLQPRALLAGPRRGPLRLSRPPNARAVGVRFRPGSQAAFLGGAPVADLAGTHLTPALPRAVRGDAGAVAARVGRGLRGPAAPGGFLPMRRHLAFLQDGRRRPGTHWPPWRWR